jgi:hypothetical protein
VKEGVAIVSVVQQERANHSVMPRGDTYENGLSRRCSFLRFFSPLPGYKSVPPVCSHRHLCCFLSLPSSARMRFLSVAQGLQ